MAQPAILFGLGATKAGSSWLHRYLSDHPECAMPRVKELHYFDMAENGTLHRERNRVRRKRERLLREAAESTGRRQAEKLAGEADLARWEAVLSRGAIDESAYLRFLNANAEGARLVGDITPAYSLLSEAMLQRMQSIAPVTRFVYLMRDPVDRLWSHLKMSVSRAGATAEDLEIRALELFDRWAEGGVEDIRQRGDYAAILGRIGRALEPERVYLGVYEAVFSDEAIGRLCAFLGISARSGDYRRKVHAGPRAVLDAGRVALAHRLLQPQYAAAAAALGGLPAQWRADPDSRRSA
jgi:hypothetical protein